MDKVFMVEQQLKKSLERDYPAFKQGDTIKVFYKIREKDKVRLHPIEGVVLKIQGALHRKTFTLRRIAYGEAFEVTFPFYSPNIARIESIRVGRKPARRKKLFYLRERLGREAQTA